MGYYDMRVKVKFCWVSMDYCDMREPQLVLKTWESSASKLLFTHGTNKRTERQRRQSWCLHLCLIATQTQLEYFCKKTLLSSIFIRKWMFCLAQQSLAAIFMKTRDEVGHFYWIFSQNSPKLALTWSLVSTRQNFNQFLSFFVFFVCLLSTLYCAIFEYTNIVNVLYIKLFYFVG